MRKAMGLVGLSIILLMTSHVSSQAQAWPPWADELFGYRGRGDGLFGYRGRGFDRDREAERAFPRGDQRRQRGQVGGLKLLHDVAAGAAEADDFYRQARIG